MKVKDLVKEMFPDQTDQEHEHIIWGLTGFPGFWSEEDGQTPEECFLNQLKEIKEKLEKGITLEKQTEEIYGKL